MYVCVGAMAQEGCTHMGKYEAASVGLNPRGLM